MSDIRLEEAKIKFQGDWLSVQDLSEQIRRKLDAGDHRVARIAAALEELSIAMENSHTLAEKVVVTKKEYEKLIEMGGGEDQASVQKAVLAYIEDQGAVPLDNASGRAQQGGDSVIKCTKWKALIEVPSDKRPIVFDCPVCGANCRLTL